MSGIFNKVIFYALRRIIPLVVKQDVKKIIFVKVSSSGCNATALYNWARKNNSTYSLELFHQYKCNDNFLDNIKRLIRLSKAALIVTTHGPIGLINRVEINTWHSVHLKATGVMENSANVFKASNSWKRVNYILSYSSFYTTTMNACFITDPNKYKITGMPRNDLLLTSDGRKNIEKVLLRKFNGKKLIFFMPTFRLGYSESQGDKNLTNLFGFEEFNEREFNNYLESNGIVLIYKLHPNEEPYLSKYINNLNPEYSFHLSDRLIMEAKLDLYDILNSCDLLMTDYSGIYFDYLLLDRPMVFIPIDLEEYEKSRGFLYGPYDEWTPGPKVIEQYSLQEEILKSLSDINYYKKDRNRLKNIVHKYHNDNSSHRVLNLIDNIMKGVT
jgi:CDP-ribitol ribitolphosphotransferase / teichoic acid ribitol-phosphate polymerase